MLFFANWFGSNRFDVDGDGDFDPEDVQAYLDGKAKSMAKAKAKSIARAKSKLRRIQAKPKPPNSPSSSSAGAGGAPAGDGDDDDDAFGNVISLMDADTDGVAQEDIAFQEISKGRFIPIFVVGECLVCVSLWLGFAIKFVTERGGSLTAQLAGLDSVQPGLFDLRTSDADCRDLRPEAWRWLSYQFTHVSLGHVGMNCIMNVALGLPLEAAHGSLRMFGMYNLGVFGGALSYFLFDSHSTVVGCSGGCYSLLGIHLADLAMNWSQKRFRAPTLGFILVLVGMDFLVAAFMQPEGKVSHAVHGGGAAFGFVCGCLMVVNMKVSRLEKVVVGVSAALSLALAAFALAWLFVQDAGPRSIQEAVGGTPGWCWLRQVLAPEIDPLSYRCARCGTAACISRFSGPGIDVLPVSLSACQERGFLGEA